MRAGKLHAVRTVMAATSVVAATADAAAVVATSAATARKDAMSAAKVVRKVGQTAGGVSVGGAALNLAALSRAANNVQISAMSSAMISAVTSEMKARSRASHAHRVNLVNLAKAIVRNAHAANAVSATLSRAPQSMPLSKTSPWPTRLPWLRPWAVRRKTPTRKPRAVSVVNVVVSAVAATSAVMNRRANHVLNHVQSLEQIARTCTTPLPPSHQWAWMRTCKAITWRRSAHRASAAAGTVMAVNAASVVRVPSVLKTPLKCLILLKIQHQMRLQPKKYGRKQLLNL